MIGYWSKYGRGRVFGLKFRGRERYWERRQYMLKFMLIVSETFALVKVSSVLRRAL